MLRWFSEATWVTEPLGQMVETCGRHRTCQVSSRTPWWQTRLLHKRMQILGVLQRASPSSTSCSQYLFHVGRASAKLSIAKCSSVGISAKALRPCRSRERTLPGWARERIVSHSVEHFCAEFERLVLG